MNKFSNESGSTSYPNRDWAGHFAVIAPIAQVIGLLLVSELFLLRPDLLSFSLHSLLVGPIYRMVALPLLYILILFGPMVIAVMAKRRHKSVATWIVIAVTCINVLVMAVILTSVAIVRV